MRDLLYLRNVATLKMDSSRCNGCGMCVKVCPHAVFAMENHTSQIKAVDRCMECGACVRNCQTNAVSVRSGVGCASGIINGLLRNSDPVCGCSDNPSGCC